MGCEGRCVMEVVFHGRPGHGSVPKAGDNALVRAAEGIRRISRYETPTVVTPGREVGGRDSDQDAVGAKDDISR